MKHWKTPAHVLTAAALLGAFSGCADSTAPEVPDPRLFVELSAGSDHTCGVTVDGRVLCWGANRSGQLGDGTTQDRRAPTPVDGPAPFTRVSAGGGTTCALTAEGVAYCWGDNDGGTLGVASPEQAVTEPRAVATEKRFVDVVSGSGHTCALDTAGRAHCWGYNHYGQLTGTHWDSLCGEDCARSPALVLGDLRFSALSASRSHTCGVTEDGSLYCWGLNDRGQLGAGGPDECDPWEQEPVPCSRSPVKVGGAQTWTHVTAGNSHTCALTRDALAHCWGSWGGHGGDPDDPEGWSRRTPEPVTGGTRFETFSAGSSYTCGVIHDGRIFCWGFGELGSGRGAADATLPTLVYSPARFASVAAGHYHACGLTPEGIAYCWGENRYGQLGDASGALSWSTPVVVKGW